MSVDDWGQHHTYGETVRSRQISESRQFSRLLPEERYKVDAMFHALVDYLYVSIERCKYTPSELREAAIFAATMYEMNRVRSTYPLDEIEKRNE